MKHRQIAVLGLRQAADLHARAELRARRRLRLLRWLLLALAFVVAR